MHSIKFLKIPFILILLFLGTSVFAEKQIYLTSSFNGMDMNSESSQYCWARSRQSENFIIFWEAGYGANPYTLTNTSYKVNVDNVLSVAEKAFVLYADSLKFITRGKSKTDLYKMIIRLRYTTDWEASGSGQDNIIGLLTLTAPSAQAAGVTMAHEVGHCFQYQVHCDNNNDNGWMYGFGSGASGGNCWWEQCAQWQAFKVYPAEQFSNYRFSEYLNNAHRHILHESPRYANYFVQDYWCYLHGMDFIGRLWNASIKPEDPVETYKRITGISQAKFNDQIYDCAARFATWDVPAIRSYGESVIAARPLPKMTLTEDNYWLIDSVNCVENYGYNAILLNTPSGATTVKAFFEGRRGQAGYRNLSAAAGWRYGFVCLQNNGVRTYSPMRAVGASNNKDTLAFECPADCMKLWLVVSGAPTYHWRHPWDDNVSNDEQWPYRVKFENTNRYGIYAFNENSVPYSDTLTYNINQTPFAGSVSSTYPSIAVAVDMSRVCQAFCMQLSEIQANFGSKVIYNAVNSNGSLNPTSTATAPGHWFNNLGNVTTWGNNSYLFSELKTSNFAFSIGQYPGKCKKGDKITIRQALVYKKSATETYKVVFVFNITIGDVNGIGYTTGLNNPVGVYNNPVKSTFVKDILQMNDVYPEIVVRTISGQVIKHALNSDKVSLSGNPVGIYLVTANGHTVKVIKGM